MRLFASPRAPRFALIAALGAAPLLIAPTAQAGWSAQPLLPPTVGQGESVKVALAPSGAVAFATKNRNIPSQLHAGSITPDGLIGGASLIAEGGGDMAIHAAPDGGRNVWWRTSSPVDIASAHINPIGEVSPVFRHGAAGVSLPVSAVDGAGTVTVAWMSDAGIGSTRISSQGGATGSATLYSIPAGSTLGAPLVVANDAGDTYVAWAERNTTTKVVRVRTVRFDATGVQYAARTVADLPGSYDNPGALTAALSPDGDLLFGTSPSTAIGEIWELTFAVHPFAVSLAAGALSATVTPVSEPTEGYVQLLPTISATGRRLLIAIETRQNPALRAYPVGADGGLGAPIALAADSPSSTLAFTDANGTTSVVWRASDRTTTWTRRITEDGSLTPAAPLALGATMGDLTGTTDRWGDIAVASSSLDNGVAVNIFRNGPLCPVPTTEASTSSATAVELDLACASRTTPSYEIVAQPAHGTVSINAAGRAVYTSDPGFGGTDAFTYKATNAYDSSVTRTARIAVTARPIDPAGPAGPVVTTPDVPVGPVTTPEQLATPPAISGVPIIQPRPAASFGKGKRKAGKPFTLKLTRVDPGRTVKISWQRKSKRTIAKAVATRRGSARFRAPKKKGTYTVKITAGTTVLFAGKVKVV